MEAPVTDGQSDRNRGIEMELGLALFLFARSSSALVLGLVRRAPVDAAPHQLRTRN